MLAPPEGLRALELPRSTPGIDPRSQGVIPRRFKQKNLFVMDKLSNELTKELTNELTEGWTDVTVEIVT